MIIDATNLITGRLASFVAKKALQGETIAIVNSEKAVITGNRKNILAKYAHRLERGMPKTGPFVYRTEDRFLKRLIRGMLPYKQHKGRSAYERIMCYREIPDQFKDKKLETLEQFNIHHKENFKYVTIGEICTYIGKKG